MRLGKNVAKTRTEGECSLAEMFISHINKKNLRLKHAFKTCEQQCFVGFKTQEVWENSKLVKV